MILHTEDRFVVYEARGDGVPMDRQSFAALTDALDLLWELRRAYSGDRVVFFITDTDDPERGWIEDDDEIEAA